MKKDLSSMLVQGGRFSSVEELKDYLVEYVLELILIELENLPKDQWDKTLKTWEKIVLLSYGLMGKPLEEREKLYERWRFDAVMKTIVENLAEALRESVRLGLLKEKQEPRKFLQVALQHGLNKEHPKKEMLLEIKKTYGFGLSQYTKTRLKSTASKTGIVSTKPTFM